MSEADYDTWTKEELINRLVQLESHGSSKPSSKGKGRAQEPIKAQADTGGTSGLLATGGHWDQPFYPGLSRSYSTSSYSSYDSEATAGNGYYHGREGIYGWVQRGAEDWRVFWLGDANSSLDDDFDDEE